MTSTMSMRTRTIPEANMQAIIGGIFGGLMALLLTNAGYTISDKEFWYGMLIMVGFGFNLILWD